MAVISVRVTEEEKNFIDFMAKFEGLSISELLKRKTFEQLEDEYDAKVGDESIAEWVAGGSKSQPMDDLYAEFGIK
ncbi:MAG: DUF6290 family protein [Lactobacillales bacterium]|jgi:hypothetical protein|nr:DUF6290 family protein [Lactobacillales bacterium]